MITLLTLCFSCKEDEEQEVDTSFPTTQTKTIVKKIYVSEEEWVDIQKRIETFKSGEEMEAFVEELMVAE